MYAVDDAVAKVDGYIISVAGGGSHVGEKRLVRIEEAGRSSATAVLVDDGRGSANGAPASEPKPPARRRTRAKAKPAAPAGDGGDEAQPAGGRAADRSADGAEPEPAADRSAEEAEPADGAAKPARKRTRSRAKPAAAKVDEADKGNDGAPEAEAAASGEDGVESTPRRRGRRGGRRRSAAKAQATSSD
jgi:ribonuclease G